MIITPFQFYQKSYLYNHPIFFQYQYKRHATPPERLAAHRPVSKNSGHSTTKRDQSGRTHKNPQEACRESETVSGEERGRSSQRDQREEWSACQRRIRQAN